jgi:hypothetical protein
VKNTETQEKAKPSRLTQWGRWEIIREVRVPTTFERRKQGGTRETITVAAHIVKTVLLDLAQWDDPDATIYKGIANISHATALPSRSVDKALRVLQEHGLLRREVRGLGQTKRSVLDWDKLETLRVPFRDVYVPSSAPTSEDDSEGIETPVPITEGIKEPSPVAARLLALPHVGKKLTAKDADRLAAALSAKAGEDAAYMAVSVLKEQTLVNAATAKNPMGYIRTCLDGKPEGWLEEGKHVAEGVRNGSIKRVEAQKYDAEQRECLVRLWRSLIGDEVEIPDFEWDGNTWLLDLALREQQEPVAA